MSEPDPPVRSKSPTPAGDDSHPASGPSSELLRRLASATVRGTRYRVEGEVARGGMGAILRVHDGELGRDLAMKVVLGDADSRDPDHLTSAQGRYLARFLEEAQITGQLDHPGIVPVHELGIDAEGRLYFTMKLVKGRELREILTLVREERDGWNRTRALTVMLKVCEAVAYAHSKGVIHRDLKPANIMVGEFGEVYVMDWGLARSVGRKDSHDVRLRTEVEGARSIRTERRREREESSESPLVTMDGDVVGTPCYMSPEQAQGRIAELGPRSDVYAVGALLYELLSGEMPYVATGAKLSSHTVLAMVLQGPPKRLLEIDPSLPEELVAITEKAMHRDANARYPDTLAMAEDLRAFLENRVVAAHAQGAIAELRKWIARNRALAIVSAATLLVALIGLAGVLYVQAARTRDAVQKNVELAAAREVAVANEARAKENETLARRKAEDVLRLSAIQDLQDLASEADLLWPVEPSRIPAYEAWLARARALADGLDGHRTRLSELRARAFASEARDDTSAASAGAIFGGTWSTGLGTLTLRSAGERVFGVFMRGALACALEGRVEGRRLEFKYKDPASEGNGWFDLAPDGRRFAGQYKGTRSSNWSPWAGSKLEDAALLRSTIANPGFDEGSAEDGVPVDWEDRARRVGGTVASDGDVRHAGPASARIQLPAPLDSSAQAAMLVQVIGASRFRGQRLRLSGWVKTSAATNGAGIAMRVENDMGMLAMDNMYGRPITGDTDWTLYSVVHDIPRSANRITLGMALFGAGTLWADDFALEVVGPEVPVTTFRSINESSFEAGNQALSSQRSWSFTSTEDRWWHNQLERLVADLETLLDPDDGLIRGSSPGHGLGIEPRLEFARTLLERSTTGSDAQRSWKEAIASIADPKQCPAYAGLALRPQPGLLPLGRDPQSGLWEFAHLLSGDVPRRAPTDKRLRMRTPSGLVFVLIPGGEFTLGAQPSNVDAEAYDPAAHANEAPVRKIQIAPFFLSKYEMTQRQWQRISGDNPSNYEAGTPLGRQSHTMIHPVEQVSWVDCERVLQRLSLVLPTEAQWEYACRAGTSTAWWTGSTVESLRGAANLPDASVADAGLVWQESSPLDGFDDGYAAHAPVDAYRANLFGLHNVHGNVWEWCRDWLGSYSLGVRDGDGERSVSDSTTRVVRGGSFNYSAAAARSTNRTGYSPGLRVNSIGVRPARSIDR